MSSKSPKGGSSTFAPINAMDIVDIKTRDVRTARVVIVEPFRGVATFWGTTPYALAEGEVKNALREVTYSLPAGVSTGKK